MTLKTMQEVTRNLFQEDPEVDFRISRDTERYRQGFARIDVYLPDGTRVQHARIRFHLKKHEFKFGCNAFMLDGFPSKEQNQRYEELFSRLFNLAVIPFYWNTLEPEEGNWRFDAGSVPIFRRPPPDCVLDFCRSHGITPKGHPLLWHHEYPWTRFHGNPREMLHKIETRFQNIAQRYRDQIGIWDVINEALDWYPTQLLYPRNPVEFAFDLAEKYFAESSELLYNETTHHSWADDHGDYSPLHLLCRQLLDRGRKLNALGLQFHLFYDTPENMLEQNVHETLLNPLHLYRIMDGRSSLNIPLNVSEITIPSCERFGGPDMQARIAERLYRIWFSHPACEAIIYWNLLQADVEEERLSGGIVQNNLTPKPAYQALERLIHNEWTTDYEMDYHDGQLNKLHGFYGDYEATVKLESGDYVIPFGHYSHGLTFHQLVPGGLSV